MWEVCGAAHGNGVGGIGTVELGWDVGGSKRVP